MATNANISADQTYLEPQAVEPRAGQSDTAPRLEVVTNPTIAAEPSVKRFPGYVRLGILLGGAVACWVAIAAVIGAL